MDYPTSLPVSAAAVNISDGAFSPLYDIVWSIKYEVINWNSSDDYGLCFFLQDNGVELSRGGRGIDLGYSGDPGIPPVFTAKGMSGGVLGVGLDTHGVFAAETTWPGGVYRDGLSAVEIKTNSITLRGGESSKYEYLNTHYQIDEFNLLSDGIKILRARLGNYGRTIYLDYREPGDTDFVNILTEHVDLDISLGDRFTPGVSFAKPLTSSNSNLNIKVHTFHIEGKETDPDISQQHPEPLEPIEVLPYTGETAVIQDFQIAAATAPITNIIMCNPPDTGSIIVTKTVESAGPYEAGDVLDYKIVVNNAGVFTLTDVVLTDTIADNLRLNSGGDLELFSGSSLLPGESKEVTYQYLLGVGDSGGSLINTATVTSAQGIIGQSTLSLVINELLDLEVVKSVNDFQEVYEVGQYVGYSVSVSNPNNVTISDITLTDSLSGPNFNILGGDVDLFTSGVSLTSNSSAEVLYEYLIDVADAGILTNVVCVSSAEFDEEVCNEISVYIEPLSALILAKEESSVGPYTLAGDTISYSISVTNPNTAAVPNVYLTDSLSGNNFNNVSDPDNLFTGTTIPALSTYVVTYDYDTSNVITVINTATVTWPVNNSATVQVAVDMQPVGPIFASIIDESDRVSLAEITNSWNTFRSKYPTDPFWLFVPGYPGNNAVDIPAVFLSDPNATVLDADENVEEVWYDTMGLSAFGPGSSVWFWFDSSGSLQGYNGEFNSSYQRLANDCAAANISLNVTQDIYENWVKWHSELNI